jgi:hypothetical protein
MLKLDVHSAFAEGLADGVNESESLGGVQMLPCNRVN